MTPIMRRRSVTSSTTTKEAREDILKATKACTTIDVDALYREVRDFVAREPDKAQQHYAAQMRRLQPYVQAWYRGMDNFPRQPYYPVNSRI